MLLYCLKCIKSTKSKNPKVVKTNNRRIMLFSKCEVCDCDSKNSKFIKQQQSRWLISSLGKKNTLSKIPLVGPLCFRGYYKLIQDIKWMK